MTILKHIESYALDLLLNNKQDEIMNERIDCFKTINSINSNDKVQFLIENISETFYNNNNNIIKNNYYKILYLNCKKLLENNKIEQLEKVFEKINKINNIPELYKYFFDKIKIKIRIKKFNELIPISENVFNSYPNRIKIDDSFDLQNDIYELKRFILKECFIKNKFDENYMTSNISHYYYFLKVLKYNLEILESVKNNNIILYNEIVKINNLILNSQKYKIPLKLKTGF